MKKIFLSLFIITTILTAVFFINKIQKVEAVGPTPTMNVGTPTTSQDFNGLWGWKFNIKTTYVPDNTTITVQTLQGIGKILSTKTITINNNSPVYNTGYILETGVLYTINFTLNTTPSILKIYSENAGSTPIPPPGILNFDPTEGVEGDTVTILGNNLTGATSVTFGAIPATIVSNTIDKIIIKVPSGVTDNNIRVTTPKGLAISSQIFKLKIAPQDIGPDGNKTGSDTYTLLAPIGKLTTAPDNMGDYFNIIFKIAIGLCGALAVIMIIIGGIQYMGNESIFGQTEAKSKITAALMGLLIALGAYALLNTINPDLLGGGGVHIDQVSAEIDPETETVPWTGTATITGTTKNCSEGYINVATSGSPSSINVCKSVSQNLTNLLAAAKSAGLIISGSGSRTYDQQVQKRKDNNCTPDIYTSPSKNCSPETARPGYSKHESGKAVDFNCNGQKMKGSACFTWLTQNASKYGFYNLASEPWHWSDDGH